MINREIFEMADKLKKTVLDNKRIAEESLNKLPDGPMKSKLDLLLKSATKGTLKPEDAKRELDKIIRDAS